jgi:hypothetical protein
MQTPSRLVSRVPELVSPELVPRVRVSYRIFCWGMWEPLLQNIVISSFEIYKNKTSIAIAVADLEKGSWRDGRSKVN